YFFNWVNAQVAKTYDADSKKKVVPELMPRALYFFRWGAAYTWITGILLLGFVYTMTTGNLLLDETKAGGPWGGTGIVLGVLIVGFFIYDVLEGDGQEGDGGRHHLAPDRGRHRVRPLPAVPAARGVDHHRRTVRHHHGGQRVDAHL